MSTANTKTGARFAEVEFPLVPPLENGDRLSRSEFERRWEAWPSIQRAELIEGVVYMPAAVRQRHHGRPHNWMSTWLGNYALLTPGVDVGTDASIRLDNDNEPQPDVHLRLPPELRSTAILDADGYVAGAPDLIVEVAASSVSIDMHDKLNAYRRNGVREYIVWRVLDEEFDWFVLREGRFDRPSLSADGWYRSELFPGLWLQPEILLHGLSDRIHLMMHEGMRSPEHVAFVGQLAALRKP